MKNNDESRRKFLKYGFIGLGALMAVAAPIKFDSSQNFAVGNIKMPKVGVADAEAQCGFGMGCGGGGGQCGFGMGCSGGGGRCGFGMGCSGS